MAMDDGTTQFFLVSSDLCLFSPTVYDEVTQKIEKKTGIRPLQIWWITTHTHSAPEVGPPGIGAVFMGSRYEHDHNTEYFLAPGGAGITNNLTGLPLRGMS